MGNKGISKLELLVVLMVASIIITMSVFSYLNWLARYKVEKTTRELYSDLMEARMLAMTRNIDHLLVLNSSSYSIVEDTDRNGRFSTGDVTLERFPRSTEYSLIKNNTGNTISFDRRGIMSPERTLWFSSSASPDYDCMVVSFTRIVMGRYANGTCIKK